MYVVITGGAGFIGSNLVAELAERGGREWSWSTGCARTSAGATSPSTRSPTWCCRRRCRRGSSVTARSVEAVMHMGANSSTTEADVDLMVRQNVRATLDLLRVVHRARKRFIYASSAATYGDGSAGFDDDAAAAALARLRPLNAYGWSKHLVDRRIARRARARRAAAAAVRGAEVLQRLRPQRVPQGRHAERRGAQLPARCGAGEPLRLFRSDRPDYADGGQLRDFIYVKDCVEVMLWLLDNPQVSGLFNVGTGQARSWLDLARALFAADAAAAGDRVHRHAGRAGGQVPVLHAGAASRVCGRQATASPSPVSRQASATMCAATSAARSLPLKRAHRGGGRRPQPVSLRRRGSGLICVATARQAANTWSTDTWSARLETGGPPTLTTGEPYGLRGSQ